MPAARTPSLSAAPLADPVLALIEEHRAAHAEWNRLDEIAGEILAGDPRYAPTLAAAQELEVREVAAFVALTTARPATLAGVLALAEYLPGIIRHVSTLPEETDAERVLRNIAVALNGLVAPPSASITLDPVLAAHIASIEAERDAAVLSAREPVGDLWDTLRTTEQSCRDFIRERDEWKAVANHDQARALAAEAELARLTALGRPDA